MGGQRGVGRASLATVASGLWPPSSGIIGLSLWSDPGKAAFTLGLSFDLIILRKTSILPRGERGSLPANLSLRKMLSGLLYPSVLTIQCFSDGSWWRQRLRNLQSRGGFKEKIASLQGKASQVNLPPTARPRASGLSAPSLQ